MKARELNRHIDRAGSDLGVYERAMAAAIEKAINEAANEAARRFKRNATDFLAADGAPPRWAVPHPDEILDVGALRAKIEKAIEQHRDAAMESFVSSLPTCIPIGAATPAATGAQQDELRALAEQAHADDEGG